MTTGGTDISTPNQNGMTTGGADISTPNQNGMTTGGTNISTPKQNGMTTGGTYTKWIYIQNPSETQILDYVLEVPMKV